MKADPVPAWVLQPVRLDRTWWCDSPTGEHDSDRYDAGVQKVAAGEVAEQALQHGPVVHASRAGDAPAMFATR